jgi:uncharacterized protein YgiM (DUF1202 family)
VEKKKKETLEELINVAPEETEAEKEEPDKLDLEEPRKRTWLRILIWLVVIGILAGAGYTAYLVYQGNQTEKSPEEKIEGTIDLDGNNQTETTPQFVYVNTTDGLNLRSDASSSSDILVVIPDKAKLTVISQQDGWYKVTYNDQTGYVNSDFVTKALPPAE